MKHFVILAIFAFSSQTALADCVFVSQYGSVLDYSDPMGFSVTAPDGSVDSCSTFSGGTGVSVRGASCEGGHEGSIFSAPSKMGGEDDIVIFQNTVWYSQGCE